MSEPHPVFDALRSGESPVRCVRCGDEDAGPWLVRAGDVWCETCADREDT